MATGGLVALGMGALMNGISTGLGISQIKMKERAEATQIRNKELDEDRGFDAFKERVNSNVNILKNQFSQRMGEAQAKMGSSGSMVGFGTNALAIAQQRGLYTNALRPELGGMIRGQSQHEENLGIFQNERVNLHNASKYEQAGEAMSGFENLATTSMMLSQNSVRSNVREGV